MFISASLGDGGGVDGSSCCVGRIIYLPDLRCHTFANAVSGIGLSICSAVPLLKYIPECLPNLIFFSLWVSAFSSENLVSSSVRLYLPQVCFYFLPFSFGQINCFLATSGFFDLFLPPLGVAMEVWSVFPAFITLSLPSVLLEDSS